MSWPNVTQHSSVFFGFHAATQSILQLHHNHTKVVCRNREAWKRPSESNSTHVMDLGHMNVVLTEAVYLHVDRGIVIVINNKISIMLWFVLSCLFPFFYPPCFCFVFFLCFFFFFFFWIKCVCCRGGIKCYVECTSVTVVMQWL